MGLKAIAVIPSTATGNVTGPASATDNAIARFDGTTGKIIQNSGATIDDSGNLTANNFSGSHSGTSSGTNTGDQTITLTGDVTGSGTGSFAATIANTAVTYAKMQNASATSRVLARRTSGAGSYEENTLSQVLDFVGSAAQGDILYRNATTWVRLAAGSSGNFLKTNGTGANPAWAAQSVAPAIQTARVQNTSFTTANNTSTTETDLFSYAIGGGLLATDGEHIEFFAAGTFANTINNKQLRVKFGSTTIFDSGALAITVAANWELVARVIRTGATTQKTVVTLTTNSSVVLSTTTYSTASATLSGAVTFKITGQGGATNDIAAEFWKVVKWDVELGA